MKLFECQNCGQPLYFENTRCESCGLRLGYLPGWETVTALEQAGDAMWRALAPPKELYRFCANAQHEVCNWLVADDHPEPFCAACRHNRMIPDLSQPQHLARWRKIERKCLLATWMSLGAAARARHTARISDGLSRTVGDPRGLKIGVYWPFNDRPGLLPP